MKEEETPVEEGKVFSIEEMGYFWQEGRNQLTLHESFCSKHLTWEFDGNKPVGHVTNVVCPFCQAGRLKLEKIEPELGGQSPNMQQTGNSCEFSCSNENCDGYFYGRYEWLFIN